MTQPSAQPVATLSPPPAPPNMRPMRFEDYEPLEQLKAAYRMHTQPKEDWLSLWLDNPLWPRVGDRWPIGWVLEDQAGRIVGSTANVPTLYRLNGRDLICAAGGAWVVDEHYRAFAPWPMDEYFSQDEPDLFFNTTVGELATPIISAMSRRVPVGDWQNVSYWVTGYRGFAKKALEKMGVPLAGALSPIAGVGLRAKELLRGKRWPSPIADIDIDTPEGFDATFDSFWQELERQNAGKLLAVRDAAHLSWHFGAPMRRGRSLIITATQKGLLRAYAVFKRQDRLGAAKRIRLIDYQSIEPHIDHLPAILRSAIAYCASHDIHVLDHLGTGLARTRSIDALAPYRHRLAHWPFYAHTNHPALAAQLSDPAVWDPSSYDGDSGFG